MNCARPAMSLGIPMKESPAASVARATCRIEQPFHHHRLRFLFAIEDLDQFFVGIRAACFCGRIWLLCHEISRSGGPARPDPAFSDSNSIGNRVALSVIEGGSMTGTLLTCL